MLFRLSDVKKSYGGTEILKGVTLQVNPGEKVGLVGRNGAGKTTVFRIITGAESADSGEVVSINGLKLGLLDQHVDFGSGETVHTSALSAFKEIHDIEAEMRLLEQQMVTDHSAETLDRYADLQIRFEHADGFSFAARAEAMLLGLGFGREMWDADTGTLSGGQKNRLGMARLLLSSADVLLLDEPTNHLDVEAVEWLEQFLSECDRTYVVISHDRYFLDRTTNRIVEIDRGQAFSYKGNYSAFLEERELRREQQRREYENQRSLINKTEEFIRRNLEGQKTKQAKSRRNMLERMERIEAVSTERSGGSFGLRKVERAGNNVLTTEDLSIGYPTRTLAAGLNISLHRGEALGIIGANGTGKTTFLRTVLGQIRELSGTLSWGTKISLGYYAQSLEDLWAGNDVIGELRRVAPMADNQTLRSFLAKFLFFGDDVFKPVSALSGGEKGRLSLAKLIYSEKNVLVLDEPTNHLDIPARESLEQALDEYAGTVIVVSHDRYFLDKIATQILSFERDGSTLQYSGNYTEFHDWKEKRVPGGRIQDGVSSSETVRDQADAEDTSSGRTSPLTDETTIKPQAASDLSKNEKNRIRTRLAEIEKLIPEMEERAASITARMGEPSVAADFGRLRSLTDEQSSACQQLSELYEEWERLAAIAETF